jgi:lipopolysaccharide export system protein LptC
MRVTNTHPPREIGRTDGDRAFRSAARHSRFVRVLRVAIPAVIVIVASVILVATFFNPFRLITTFPIDPGKISLSGTKIVMELPRVTGFTADQRPYELTARAAFQDLTKLEVLELNEITAKVELKDGQHVNIKSINGVYDTKAEVLRLNDHITIDSTSGYEGRLSEATVHIASGNIVSESPVEVKLPNGMLTANRLEVRENGAVIKFGGGVEMNLKPEQLRPADQQDSQLARQSDSPPVRQDATPPAGAPPMQTSQRRGAMSP